MAYTGYTGILLGAETGSLWFTPLTSSLVSRIAGSALNLVATPQGRAPAIQQTGGVAQTWVGGHLAYTYANPSPNISNLNSVISVGASGGDANRFSGSIGGYAVFDALTQAEMGDLAAFFDDINVSLGRPVFFNELLCGGDSNTFGTGAGPASPTLTQRFSYLAAQELRLIENAQGIPSSGLAWSDGWATQRRQIERLLGTSARFNVLMLGTNDVANLVQETALANYEALLVSAQRARVQNLMVVGVGSVNWTAAGIAYPGTGYANNPHGADDIANYNASVAALCAEYGIAYADLSTMPNVLQTDGVHNSVASHASQAAWLTNKMRELLL